MIDLTRALYLGFEHRPQALAPWDSLTTGRPAVLDERRARATEQRLATLLGFPRVTLAPSTLHVVTDLYRALPDRIRTIHVDACTYAVSRWALEHAAYRGVAIRPFRTLAQLDRCLAPGDAIVCDAICMRCRRVKPLAELQRRAGLLIVDDSQGIGLLGERPSPSMSYGLRGGGTLRWSRTPPARVIVLGSLAKAFGAPIAFLAGAHDTVAAFERNAGTRVHASSFNAAAVAALDAALQANAERGDALRAMLLDRVRRFRAACSQDVLAPGLFPMQATVQLADARRVEERLRARGIVAIPLRRRLGFILNATHDPDAATEAGAIVGEALSSSRRRPGRGARVREAAAHVL